MPTKDDFRIVPTTEEYRALYGTVVDYGTWGAKLALWVAALINPLPGTSQISAPQARHPQAVHAQRCADDSARIVPLCVRGAPQDWGWRMRFARGC